MICGARVSRPRLGLRACRLHEQPLARPRRPVRSGAAGYATGSGAETLAAGPRPGGQWSRRRQRLVLFGGGAALAFAVSYANNDHELVRFAFHATTRTMRVASGLSYCCMRYYRTINARYASPEEYEQALSQCHSDCAHCTKRVFERNGGMYLKLGQHLSAMAYLIPMEWVEVMRDCQDKCPPSSIHEIRDMVWKDRHETLEQIFSEFDPEPLGVASLAQVHRAVLRENGQEVAVKLQHPALQRYIPVDMKVAASTFKFIKWMFPEFSLTWLSDEMQISLPQELDFRRERVNAIKTKDYFSAIKGSSLYIPNVYWAEQRLLVMEFVRGIKIDETEALDKANISREQVSAELSRIFNEMIFCSGHLHCDPHGGNVLIRRKKNPSNSAFNFEIVLLDHGLYREIPLKFRRSYAKLWLSIINFDEQKLKRYAMETANIQEQDVALFISAITGRDYKTLQKSISSARTREEYNTIQEAVNNGLIKSIVKLLAGVPRLVLLLLKTNDLTRALDESLHTRTGLKRVVIILARYCNWAVFDEERETARAEWHTSVWMWPRASYDYMSAWTSYSWTITKLLLAEAYVMTRAALPIGRDA